MQTIFEINEEVVINNKGAYDCGKIVFINEDTEIPEYVVESYITGSSYFVENNETINSFENVY
jgi:hypothetical protein